MQFTVQYQFSLGPLQLCIHGDIYCLPQHKVKICSQINPTTDIHTLSN